MRLPFRPLLGLLIGIAAFAPSLSAQLVRGGDVVVADYYANAVFRVDPVSGAVSMLHSGAPFAGVSDADVTRAGEVLICDFSAGAIHVLTPGSGVSTLAAGLSGPIRMAVDHDGSVIVTSLLSGELLRVRRNGVVSTIAFGFTRPMAVTVEPGGDYLVTEDTSGLLWRVDRLSGGRTLLAGGLSLAQGVANFSDGDYAVSSGHPDFVLRIPRAGGSPNLFVSSPPLGNPDDLHADGSGGFYVSESGSPLGNRITHLSADGVLSVVTASPQLLNPEGLGVAPSLSGPMQVSTGPGSQFSIFVDLPDDAGFAYRLVASRSAFPGQLMPAGDPRGTALNADALFSRTRQGDLPPFTRNWVGQLDGNGRAVALLNLSRLAPGALAGTSLHLHAVALSAAAPSGIRNFSNVMTLRF